MGLLYPHYFDHQVTRTTLKYTTCVRYTRIIISWVERQIYSVTIIISPSANIIYVVTVIMRKRILTGQRLKPRSAW